MTLPYGVVADFDKFFHSLEKAIYISPHFVYSIP